MSLLHHMPPPLSVSSRPRHDWTREEVRALFALPFPELIFRRRRRSPAKFRSDRGADLDAAVDQDRRLPGRLRLLPAEPRNTTPASKAEKLMALDAVLAEARAAQAAGASALLHGRGLARAEGPRSRQGLRHGRGRQGARAGDLRHARHADRRDQARRLKDCRPRLLQPQPRHLAGISTARSSPRAPTRTGSIRSSTCATPASMSAAAASSAWARAPTTASA